MPLRLDGHSGLSSLRTTRSATSTSSPPDNDLRAFPTDNPLAPPPLRKYYFQCSHTVFSFKVYEKFTFIEIHCVTRTPPVRHRPLPIAPPQYRFMASGSVPECFFFRLYPTSLSHRCRSPTAARYSFGAAFTPPNQSCTFTVGGTSRTTRATSSVDRQWEGRRANPTTYSVAVIRSGHRVTLYKTTGCRSDRRD